MTRYMFPLMIITLTVAIAGPLAVDWVAGLTLDLAAETADKIAGN